MFWGKNLPDGEGDLVVIALRQPLVMIRPKYL